MREASGNLLAGETVRVAGAVEPLVGGADDGRDAVERGRGAQDPLADQRVLADEGPLAVVERPGLVQDLVRHRELAQVVELRRRTSSSSAA